MTFSLLSRRGDRDGFEGDHAAQCCAAPSVYGIMSQRKKQARKPSETAGMAPEAARAMMGDHTLGAMAMRSLLLLLGLSSMPASQLMALAGFVGLLSMTLGWIADAIMRDAGFGVLLNAALLLAGAILSMLLWQHLGYAGGPSLSLNAAIVAGASGIALLIGCGAGKRFV